MSLQPEAPGGSSPRPESISPDQAKQLADAVWAALGTQPGDAPSYKDQVVGTTFVTLCGYTTGDVRIETSSHTVDEHGLSTRLTTYYDILQGSPSWATKEEPIDPHTGLPVKITFDPKEGTPYQMISDAIRAAKRGDSVMTEERFQEAMRLLSEIT